MKTMIEKLSDKSKMLLSYIFALSMFVVVYFAVPSNTAPQGPILFLPVVFMLVFIFTTKRMIEGFVWSIMLITFMMSQSADGMITDFIQGVYEVLSGEDYQWIVFVSFAAAGLIALIRASGSIQAFTDFMLKVTKTKKSSLIVLWFLNLLTFFDEYLHFMVMGPATVKVSKERKISKEMLTYILKATGVAFGTLLPMSIWTFFISKELEGSGIAAQGQGISFFMRLIPYNFFTWISVLISLLVVLGIIPIFGPMKKAEKLAEQGIFNEASDGGEELDSMMEGADSKKKPRLINFFFPLILLFGIIFYLDFDSAKGAFIALIITFFFYTLQGLLTPEDCEDTILTGGIKEMAFMFVLVLLTLEFSILLERSGFVDYVIQLVQQSGVNPAVFPLLLFWVFSFTEFAVSLNWGLFIITFPMVLPMATAIGANPMLCLGAILSAVMFGTNASPVSESTIMPCAFTNTDPMAHTMANLPYQLLGFGISSVMFLVAGFVL